MFCYSIAKRIRKKKKKIPKIFISFLIFGFLKKKKLYITCTPTTFDDDDDDANNTILFMFLNLNESSRDFDLPFKQMWRVLFTQYNVYISKHKKKKILDRHTSPDEQYIQCHSTFFF